MADIARETRSKTSLAAPASGGEESAAGAEVTKKTVPKSEHPLVIRTDFSDQATWEAIVKAIRTTTSEGFDADVELLDDPAFQGLTSTQVLGLVSEEYSFEHSFLMIVDHVTITEPEHPLVVVNLYKDEAEADEDCDEPEVVEDGDELKVVEYGDESVKEPQYGREFRAIPAAIQAIENNLSLANMDFGDFADAVNDDGVFRGWED